MNKISNLAIYSDNNMISTIDYAKLIKLLADYSFKENEKNKSLSKGEDKRLVRNKLYGKRKILDN